MICSELILGEKPACVDQTQYGLLFPDEHNLILGWFNRARRMKASQGTTGCEAFFCTWLAFNAWAVCVTDEDRDFKYIDAIKRDSKLCEDFMAGIGDPTSSLALAATEFADFWPLFNVKDLRKQRVHAPSTDNRRETVHFYLKCGISSFAPKCWTRHRDTDEPIPIDWPHTLSALYQVRCNFFHGGKMLSSEADRRIITAANKTLLAFLEQGHSIK